MIHRTLLIVCLLVLATEARGQNCIVDRGYLNCGSAGWGTFSGDRLFMEPSAPKDDGGESLADWTSRRNRATHSPPPILTPAPMCPAGYTCTPK